MGPFLQSKRTGGRKGPTRPPVERPSECKRNAAKIGPEDWVTLRKKRSGPKKKPIFGAKKKEAGQKGIVGE